MEAHLHRLIFGDTPSGRPALPTAEECAHTATWAADRGYLELAAPLMDLARALWRQRIETPTMPVPVCRCGNPGELCPAHDQRTS